VGIVSLVAADTGFAQTARSGGNASAQLMQQMQELASERTTLQAENDKLKKQLADVTKDRDALKAGQQTEDRRAKDSAAALQHSKAQGEAEAQELTQTKAKLQELIGKFRETLTKMREIEAENSASKQTLATRQQQLSTCAAVSPQRRDPGAHEEAARNVFLRGQCRAVYPDRTHPQ